MSDNTYENLIIFAVLFAFIMAIATVIGLATTALIGGSAKVLIVALALAGNSTNAALFLSREYGNN